LEQSVEQFNLDGDTEVDLRVKDDSQKKKGKIITDENEEKIAISFSTYKQWFGKYYGFSFILLTNCSMFLFTFSRITNDYILGVWAYNENGDQYSRCWWYSAMCFIFTFLVALGIYLRSACCQLYTLRAGRIIHEEMVDRVLHAPVNLYFDVTPIGRILNKFSKDLNGLETQSGWMMSATLSNFYSLM
jgi:ABC-type multidrug transport system fused ATPase/permease subunit